MKREGFLEAITTKYIVVTIALMIVLIVGTYSLILFYGITDINSLATFVDTVFKTIAILAGAVWALNRYYTGRVDATQLKVEHDISFIPARRLAYTIHNESLLVYRLDVTNTSTSLIAPYQQFLEIESLFPSSEGIEYKTIYRWPPSGLHPGGPIEPGSWSAINNVVSIPENVQAIRLYLELQFSDGNAWNWHKTFDVAKYDIYEN